ncbi:hypothetical protein LCGC14_0953680 [marine sediment metagenome]|uniref:Uncharacterized protein n=1 Tax=marine sediment metagenome TaxID=412755 RepID=A0A0F9RMY2_9ZZZZ
MAIKDELDELIKKFEDLEGKVKKHKKFRLPLKAKISNRKMREGYVTVLIIRDNRNIDFVKEPIIDSTFKLNDTIHALEDKNVFFYKGKPFIIQPKKKLTQYSPENKVIEKDPLDCPNETYGQKYVMARMESDKLTLKKQLGWGMSIGVLIIVGIIGYSIFTGGL